MDRRQIGVKLALDVLELDAQGLDTFDNRLIIQKAVCLAQAAGVALGYYFRWYLRGPYSPALTRDVFGIAAELAANFDESQGWTLDADSVGRLESIREIIRETDQNKRARWLELLASVHFLVERGQAEPGDAAGMQRLLATYGKDFTEQDIEAALGVLRQNGLIVSK